MNRGMALRQKVPTKFGTIYCEVEFGDKLVPERVSLSHHAKFHDTAVGDSLFAIADAFNDLLADLKFSRAARSKAEVPAPPSAAASVSPVETGRDVTVTQSAHPGLFSHAGQHEQPFEGGGE